MSSDKDGARDESTPDAEGGFPAAADDADAEATAGAVDDASIDGGVDDSADDVQAGAVDSSDDAADLTDAGDDASDETVEAPTAIGGSGPGRSAVDDADDTDDRDDFGAGELQPAGVSSGRVSAGSARAAARASAAATRPAASPAKGRATPSRDRGAGRGNMFQRLGRFLREVVAEL
ncbi:MAG TPA: hypothetical protein VIC62_04235, partial [Nakamurella sp.]